MPQPVDEYARKHLESVTVNMDPELFEFIVRIAATEDIPPAVLCRQLIARGLVSKLCGPNSWKVFKKEFEERENF